MLRNTLGKLTVLTAILGCASFLTITTGCDESLSNADIKVQERAAYPLYWKEINRSSYPVYYGPRGGRR